jgi:hypothetical protein
LYSPGSLELFNLITPKPLPYEYEYSLALAFHTTPHDSTSHLILLMVAYRKLLFFKRRLGPPIMPQQRGRSIIEATSLILSMVSSEREGHSTDYNGHRYGTTQQQCRRRAHIPTFGVPTRASGLCVTRGTGAERSTVEGVSPRRSSKPMPVFVFNVVHHVTVFPFVCILVLNKVHCSFFRNGRVFGP